MQKILADIGHKHTEAPMIIMEDFHIGNFNPKEAETFLRKHSNHITFLKPTGGLNE